MIISRHKISRMGEQMVFDLLDGAKWSENTDGLSYDLIYKGLKIDVNTSTIRKGTGFVFSNAHGYKPELINIFLGIDNNKTFIWIEKGIEKTGYYGKIKYAITKDKLKAELEKLI